LPFWLELVVSRLPFLTWSAFFASFPLSEGGAVSSLKELWNFRFLIADLRFGWIMDKWMAVGAS
jgi:hypothetical protein